MKSDIHLTLLHKACLRMIGGLLVPVMVLGMGMSLASAREYIWEPLGGGKWADAANWSESGDQFPNAPGDSAVISRALEGVATIQMPDEAITLGGLDFGLGGVEQSVAFWTLQGSQPLVFSSADGAARVRAAGGIHVIAMPVSLASDLIVEADHTLRLIHSKPLNEVDGSWSVTVERGRLDFRMRSDYSGGTFIKPGASVFAVRPNAVGVGPVSVEDGGRFVIVHDGGFVENAFTIEGNGEGYGALRMGSEVVETATEAQLMRLEERSVAPTPFNSGGFAGEITLNGEAAISVVPAGSGQITGTIVGDGTLAKIGGGRLELQSVNSYKGGTRVIEGILVAGVEGSVPENTPVDMAGGVLELLASQSMGPLQVGENSVIRLPEGVSGTLAFADSSKAGWVSGKSLVIEGWAGDQSGGQFKIGFGGGAGGLTAKQLGQIQFRDSAGAVVPARLLANGELVPQS